MARKQWRRALAGVGLATILATGGFLGSAAVQSREPAKPDKADADERSTRGSADRVAGIAKQLSTEPFEKLHKLIKPYPGEYAWREEIPWLIRIQEARAKAAAEGKPLLLWVAADGHPCGAV